MLSALNIVGEHLARGGRLTRLNELLLSRSFSAAAFWSPFWGASAAAIAYSPGAKVNVLAVCGASMAAVALIYSIGGLVRTFRTELTGYHGYALSWRALRVPLVLVTIVLVAHDLAPELIIPHVVLISSVAMTLTVLFIRQPRVAHKLIIDHARLVLPRLKGEAALFASAGVLAVGLSALFGALELDLPISDFNVLTAWLCTLVMALMSLVGVHPVISIAAVAAIAPLDPNPTLYAMAGMLAWGASAAAGPISGLNIFLNGRFGTNNFAIARANLPYLFVVLLLSGPVLLPCSLLV